jgi:superfamily II DNA or RNA helicase
MLNYIKQFCKIHAGKRTINFDGIKNPINLNNRFGMNVSENTLKGRIFEVLLEELFNGNGYIVDRLGNGGNDGGCDLLVKYSEKDEVRLVVQAKNWNTSINKYDIIKELGKFKDNYKKQYNLSNNQFCFVTWRYVKESKKILSNELNIKVWDEQDITELFRNYKWIYPRKSSIILEEYQKRAFREIVSYWNRNQRCYVEFATGTGKTYIIAKLVEQLLQTYNHYILILSPSNLINNRILELLGTILSSNHIARRYNPLKNINLLTYQYVFHNSEKMNKRSFTHIIMDEAHRAGATKWFSKGLQQITNYNAKIVGFSATMDRYSTGFNIKDFLHNNIAGQLKLSEAIAKGILPSGDYVLSALDIKPKINDIKDEIKSKYKSNQIQINSLNATLDTKMIKDYSIQTILRKYYGSFRYSKILVFCESMEHAIDSVALLNKTFFKVGKLTIKKITSYNSKRENKEILASFSYSKPSNKQLFFLIAIDMLNEGIDISNIDSVIMFRRTESPRIYFQQIGRALRSKSNKRPLIFDCVMNYKNLKNEFFSELEFESSKYKKLLIDYGLNDLPKQISIVDELKDITKIINELESQLDLYQTYIEAKKSVQRLGITSEKEYKLRFKEDPQLPSKPYVKYNGIGWIDYYDFFGTKRPEFYKTKKEAMKAVRSLNITSFTIYKRRYKEDPLLPSQPDRTYKENGVKWDWDVFFGKTGNYKTYEKAQKATRRLLIQSPSEYSKRHNEDPRLPCHPDKTYMKSWKGFEHFLGIEKKKLYPTLKEAKKAVRRLNIHNEREYRKNRHLDTRLPATPYRFYKDLGWKSFPDYCGNIYEEKYSSYSEAKKAVKRLGIKSGREYSRRYKEDPRLPSDPKSKYHGIGWKDFYSFLDSKKRSLYKNIEDAKQSVMKLGMKNREEYVTQKRYKEDGSLPSQPNVFYKNRGWKDWNDYIPRYYINIEDAKRVVMYLKIKNRTEYIKLKRYKEDPFLPSNPEKTYAKKGWISWGDFLGNKILSNYQSLAVAKEVVKKLNIKSMSEYHLRKHEDPRLPSNPHEFYQKRGWISSYDFLGISCPQEYYRTYREAQEAVQKLGFTLRSQYREKKGYKADPRLPSDPEQYYKESGWVDWYHFLGIEKIEIYTTYFEAKRAVTKLKISTREEYRKDKAYKRDKRLPSSPDKKYKNKGWSSWSSFLNGDISL